MSSQRYQRVATSDEDDHFENTPVAPQQHYPIPSSPPPSFRSRASSPTSRHNVLSSDPLASGNEPDRTLADAFDSPSDDGNSEDDDDDDGMDDRQRLMRGQPETSTVAQSGENIRQGIQRRVTQLPAFTPASSGRVYGGGTRDGVFANMSAKPTRGEEVEEKPPSYEQAAADATPPYWETTILAPGMDSNEVYVDGLPVGSIFSFVWNAMISVSFQFVGFLLTYLLHTTHAAKNGSRAGLGITLINIGFGMKGAGLFDSPTPTDPSNFASGDAPPDPNSHDFDPQDVPDGGAGAAVASSADMATGLSTGDWLAYILMIVGWFILIRSISDFLRARRHEQLVLQSPDHGLGVAVVAEGESPERSV